MPIHSRSPNSAEPTTPTRGPLTDVLKLTQEIALLATPRTTCRVNGLLSAKDCRIADLTNKPMPPAGINESEVPNPATVEERTRSAGCRFSLLKLLFFVDDECVWAAEQDNEFNRVEEFDSKDGRIQGQLLDVLNEEWLSLAFMDGMDGECATIGNHICSQSLATLVDDSD
ncbi:hypothetical protein B0H14DRAFT_2982566, partial [Mycena olivaceomarginata]